MVYKKLIKKKKVLLWYITLTGHVEIEFAIRVHTDFDPFKNARLYLFEVDDIITSRSVPVVIEVKIITSET